MPDARPGIVRRFCIVGRNIQLSSRQYIFPAGVMIGINYRSQWINVIVRNKQLQGMSELSLVVGATDAPRGSHTQRQSRQQKRRQNSEDGDDDQQFNQREAVSFCLSHIDWTVTLLDRHEWLIGEASNLGRASCLPTGKSSARNRLSRTGQAGSAALLYGDNFSKWSRPSDAAFRLSFQRPTTSLPA